MILQRKEFNFLPGEREAGERRSLNLLSRAIFHARENLNKIIYYRERNLLCVDIFKRKIEKFLTEFPKLWEFKESEEYFFFLFIFSQINRKRGVSGFDLWRGNEENFYSNLSLSFLIYLRCHFMTRSLTFDRTSKYIFQFSCSTFIVKHDRRNIWLIFIFNFIK